MFEVLILTILSVLGYFIIAGLTAGIIIAMVNNVTDVTDDVVKKAIACGVIWPFATPFLIVCGIMILINKLI